MLRVSNNNILRVKIYSAQSTDHINNLKNFLWYRYSNDLARHIIINVIILLKEDLVRFKLVVGSTNAFIVFSRLDIRRRQDAAINTIKAL